MVLPMSQILKGAARKGQQVQAEMSEDIGADHPQSKSTKNVPKMSEVKPKQMKKTSPPKCKF